GDDFNVHRAEESRAGLGLGDLDPWRLVRKIIVANVSNGFARLAHEVTVRRRWIDGDAGNRFQRGDDRLRAFHELVVDGINNDVRRPRASRNDDAALDAPVIDAVLRGAAQAE